MGRSPRVLQVTPRFLPQVGGIERHVFEVASRLPDHGIGVEVLTTDGIGGLPAREEMQGITVRRVPAWPRGRDWHFAPSIARHIREGDWDVIHVQGVHTLVPPLAMMAAGGASIPYVVTFHTGGHSSALRRRARSVQWISLRPWLRGAARLIGVSRFERDLFQRTLKLAHERFMVIPNGAEMPDVAGPGMNPVDPNLVVSVGRAERYKGHWRLVEAMPALLAQRPDARLRIVGDGPDRDRLIRLADELGIGSRVEVGGVPTDDRFAMAEIISRAGLFVSLSEYEAHPIAVMEALSLGRPVLVANATGLREIAESGLARSVAVDTAPDELAAAIVAALDAPTSPRHVALPTWDDCVTSLAAVYREVARS